MLVVGTSNLPMSGSELQFLTLEARAEAIPRALRQHILDAHNERRFVFDQIMDDAVLRMCVLAEANPQISAQIAGLPNIPQSTIVSRDQIGSKTHLAHRDGTLFSDAIHSYKRDLEQRQGGEGNQNVVNLLLRARMFTTLMGDVPITKLNHRVFREFGYAVSFLPASIARRGSWDEGNLLSILQKNGFHGFGPHATDNSSRAIKETPISEKTLVSKCLSVLATAINQHCGNQGIQSPVQNFRFHLPDHTPRTQRRKRPTYEAVSTLIRKGVDDGRLVQAMLPVLGRVTGRRLGLLAFLRHEHLSEIEGHFVARVPRQYQVAGRLENAPIKGERNSDLFVLHKCLVDVGFIDYMKSREQGWVFQSLHLPRFNEPASVAQRRIDRLAGDDADMVFHQLRHLAKGELRATGLHPEAIKLQLGHAADGSHEGYARDLEVAEIAQIAKRDLPGADLLTLFEGFDFKKSAKLCLDKAVRESCRRANSFKNPLT